MKTNFLRMLLAILILTFPSLGQISSGGEVVEVVDGRTIVVATANGRVKVELQCLEIPEPGQQLYETVNDHLRKLLAGRIVEYKPKMILPDRVIGRVHLNNLDVSQQMLRDGAAWHLPKKISGQDKAEFDAYASTETVARAEKRGVWSIPGLKSPSARRLENEERFRRIEASKPTRPVLVGVSQFQTDTRGGTSAGRQRSTSSRMELDAWVSVFAGDANESPGIKIYNDPKGAFTSIYTSVAFVELAAGSDKQKLECRAIYGILNFPNGLRDSLYILGFRAISEDRNFSKRTRSMTVVADKQVISLGLLHGKIAQASIGVEEIMYFRISKASLKKIANAGSVEFRINGLKGPLSTEAKDLFRQLVTGTE